MTGNTTDKPLTEDSDTNLSFVISMIQAIGYITLFVFGVPLNSFLISLIIKYKSLHQRGFIIAIQVLVCNLLLTLVLLPTSTMAALLNRWALGEAMCNASALFQQWMQTERWLLTLLLALDRTLCVWKPFTYAREMGNKLVIVFSVVSWVTSFVTALVPLKGIGSCYRYLSRLKLCHINRPNDLLCTVYVLLLGTFILTLGGIIPVVLYTALYCKARKISKTIQSQMPEAVDGNTTTNNLTNGSRRKRKGTFIILFFTVMGLSIPFYVVLVYHAGIALSNETFTAAGSLLFAATQFFYYGLVVADPLSLMINKDVKDTMEKFKNSLHSSVQTLLKH